MVVCIIASRNVHVGGVRLERWWDKRMTGWEGPGPFAWRHPSAACTAWASELVARYATQPLQRLTAMDREDLASPGAGRECAKAYLWVALCTLRELEGGMGAWSGWDQHDDGALCVSRGVDNMGMMLFDNGGFTCHVCHVRAATGVPLAPVARANARIAEGSGLREGAAGSMLAVLDLLHPDDVSALERVTEVAWLMVPGSSEYGQ